MSIVGGIVVDDGYILGALQKPVEVVGVDGHLVVDSSKSVCLAYGVGNERRVVNALRHVALVARQQQHMVKVEVARFQYTHYLYAHNRFAMEWYSGGGDELLGKAT